MTESPSQNDPTNTARAAWARATRYSQTWRAQPTWVQRVVMGAVVLVVLGLTAILLVSSLVVGLVVAGVAALAMGGAALVRRLKGEDRGGRKNVRIIIRH
jgi:uncharacterized membrane protein HdeD (DUF308 family)